MRIAIFLAAALSVSGLTPAAAQTPADQTPDAPRLILLVDADAAASGEASVPGATPSQTPVLLQVGLGGASHLAGSYGGYYLGDAIYSRGGWISDGGMVGLMVGGPLAAALTVTAVGERGRFGRTLLGAALGQIAGIALYTALDAGSESEWLGLTVPLSSAVGATVANGIE